MLIQEPHHLRAFRYLSTSLILNPVIRDLGHMVYCNSATLKQQYHVELQDKNS